MNTGERERAKQRLDRIAWYLDSSIPIPGLKMRFGIDPLIGLFPGIGDTLGALMSSYILSEAARLGAPKSVLFKMAFNIAVDAILGTVPVLGDLFDVVWKANQRNVQLLGTYLERPRKAVVASRLFVWSLAVLLVGFVIFVGMVGFALMHWAWLEISGKG
jgi:hypothetical protein